MARVLLLGESWFVHSIHQKGFDSFTSSHYTEGGAEFLAALRSRGHDVNHIPAHRIELDFPKTLEELNDSADVVVISDVGANTFQLTTEVFTKSQASIDLIAIIAQFVSDGGGLLMIGGYMTFTGIEAKAHWGRTQLKEVLPITMLDVDDRQEMPYSSNPMIINEHEVVEGLDQIWPPLLGLNKVTAKSNAKLLATCGDAPLLVIGEYERGRSAAFTSDIAPHWATPEFMNWTQYSKLFDQIVIWLSGRK